jgi:hypothetical protein
VTLAADIELLVLLRDNFEYDGNDDAKSAFDRVIVILSPLAAMSPEQLDAMLVQTTQLHVSWSQSAEHTLTDAEYERCALIAGGYMALAEALRAVKS